VHSRINVKELTYLTAVKYAAERCKEQLPKAYTHVAGWRVGVNIETLCYMWRDGYFDYSTFKDIEQTFKRDMQCFKKGKKQYLSRRLFAPLGARLLTALYKGKFKKQIKEIESKKA
jgi:hypothetical protein